MAPSEPSPAVPGAIVVTLGARPGDDDGWALCASVARRLQHRPGATLVCDVSQVTEPDARTIETLARLALTVRRAQGRLLLRSASRRLLDLVELVGLTGVLPPEDPPSGVQRERQAEEREHPVGVEEVVQADDATP